MLAEVVTVAQVCPIGAGCCLAGCTGALRLLVGADRRVLRLAPSLVRVAGLAGVVRSLDEVALLRLLVAQSLAGRLARAGRVEVTGGGWIGVAKLLLLP